MIGPSARVVVVAVVVVVLTLTRISSPCRHIPGIM